MTLQNLVNQTWYAAKKATFGVALGFLLVSAPRVAYGQTTGYIPQANNTGLSYGAIDQPNNQIDDIPVHEGDPVPGDFPDVTEHHSEGLLLRDLLSRLSPEQQRAAVYLLNHPRVQRFAEPERVSAELTKRLKWEPFEQSRSPSLKMLKDHYHRLEHKKEYSFYKAKAYPGFYVYHPQVHRIYYVEERDQLDNPYEIADEDGTIILRKNEKGVLVRVQSSAEEKSPVKDAQQLLEEKVAEKDVKQPTAADIGIFQNIFDCQSKLELYSATGAGVGSLAIIGPLAALYIRHRRRRSRQK